MLVVEKIKLLFAAGLIHHHLSRFFVKSGKVGTSYKDRLSSIPLSSFIDIILEHCIDHILMELQELNAIVEAFLDRIIDQGKTFDAVLKGVKVEPIEKAGTIRCSLYVRQNLQNRMGNLHGGCTGWSTRMTLIFSTYSLSPNTIPLHQQI
jgi:hypothetical protein